jgi:hypothetical protein
MSGRSWSGPAYELRRMVDRRLSTLFWAEEPVERIERGHAGLTIGVEADGDALANLRATLGGNGGVR